MGLLDDLLGSGQQQQQQQQDYQEYLRRYQQGNLASNITGQEALQRYNHVTDQLPQDAYVQSAEAAFSNMSPQQRAQFMQYLQQQAQQQNVSLPSVSNADVEQYSPGQLAHVAGQLHQKQPGLLGQILSGGGGASSLNNPIAKAALAGIAAMAAQRILGQR